MQPVVAMQPIQMQLPAGPGPSRRSRYSCSVKALGILQIILTGVSTVFGIAAACTGSAFGIIVPGAWGALLFFLPAGILGVLSVTVAVTARRCLAIACMVMSILASVMAAANIGMYGASIALTGWYYDSYYGHYDRYSWYRVPMSMDIILTIVSLTEFIVSIVASVYCCYVMAEYRPTQCTIQYVSTQGNPGMMAYNQPAVGYPPSAPGAYGVGQPTNPPPSYLPTTASPQVYDGKPEPNIA